jgi:hypothetical protein
MPIIHCAHGRISSKTAKKKNVFQDALLRHWRFFMPLLRVRMPSLSIFGVFRVFWTHISFRVLRHFSAAPKSDRTWSQPRFRNVSPAKLAQSNPEEVSSFFCHCSFFAQN